MIKGLIFDCDGTLADTMPLHWRAWNAVMLRHGIHFSEERFYAMGGVPSRDILKLLREEQGLGIDPLGYYLGGWGYAYLQVLGEAIAGAKSVKDDDVAAYLRGHAFDTVMGSGISFGKNGEWTKGRALQVQYHGITDEANLETWRGMSYQTVLTPEDEKTGDIIYPYEKALAATPG